MTAEAICEKILKQSASVNRYVLGIAGPPGAGKSTLANKLANHLPPGTAKVVPMDGFHYDNLVLNAFGLRSRKGAPETFDYHGFALLLRRIREMEPSIAVPIFDRTADLSRSAADIIDQQVKFVIVEGNYLLLDEAPWKALDQLFDLTIFLDVPIDELRRRLMQRWLDLGYSAEKAAHWVAGNDIPNAHRVLQHRRQADLII